MKKILQVCAVDITVENILLPLVTMLQKEGYQVHCACSNTGRVEHLRKLGVHVLEVPIERKIDLFSNMNSIRRLIAIMKRGEYDIVHVHTPIASVLGRIAARIAGVSHVLYTAHGFYFHEGMSSIRYRMFYGIEKLAARWLTDRLLLVNQEDWKLCVKNRFLNEDYAIHISNGVDIGRFAPDMLSLESKSLLRTEWGIQEHDLVFTYVGRFVKEKGLVELLDAFHQLYKLYPHVKLLLVGEVLSTDRDQDTVIALQELMVHPAIIRTGQRKDIPELLAISDVFVLPSYREGLPVSIMEAMAMAKPIITTNIRGCREQVIDGYNGFLIPAGSSADLLDRMRQLAEDKELRRQFGANSRERVVSHYDMHISLDKQRSLYHTLIRR